MFWESKIIVFTFYFPLSRKLLGFPAQLFEKLLNEMFLSPPRIIHCQEKNNTETFQPVWLFPKVIHGCPGVCDGHSAQGKASHLLLFPVAFHHERLCRAPSAEAQWFVSQDVGLPHFQGQYTLKGILKVDGKEIEIQDYTVERWHAWPLDFVDLSSDEFF